MFSSNKTDLVKHLLVRYIRDHQLGVGDRLPPQGDLRRIFNAGSATIGRAINDLRLDGVLDVRDKIGVFVLDPLADGLAARTVGICARRFTDSPYYSSLLCALQLELVKSSCQLQMFCYEKSSSGSKYNFNLNDFTGLKRSIDCQKLDGIIHLDDFTSHALRYIHKQTLPAIFVGSEGVSPNGIFYDLKQFVSLVCDELSSYGSQRPALYCSSAVVPYLEGLFIEKTSGKGKIYSGETLEDGKSIAHKVIALPPQQRPDLIIYLDDIIAQKITSVFSLELSTDELPKAVILRNKQLMISYAVKNPVFCEIDLSEVAKRACSMLINAMQEGNPNPGKEYYELELFNK